MNNSYNNLRASIQSINLEDEITEDPEEDIPEEGTGEEESTGVSLKLYNSKLLSNKPKTHQRNKPNPLIQREFGTFSQTLNHIPTSMKIKKPMGKKSRLEKKMSLQEPLFRGKLSR